MNASRWSLEESAAATDLKRFIAEKCGQVRAEIRAPEHPRSPESSAFFAAAERCDWPALFEAIAAMHRAVREGHSRHAPWAVYPVEWAVVNEVGAALEEFAAGAEEYAIAFGRDIIDSIPAGSIYLGGTDPGRFLVTALSRSHPKGEPFFTVTQNALADQRSYLRYVRGMYGSRIAIPTEAEATRALTDYQADLRRRRAEGKLLPGEVFEGEDGNLEMRGQVSVMAVNGLLSQLLFERNPEREFFVEESYPLDWMYPHLLPHGLILKINRQPLSELPDEIVRRDREYWRRYIGPMIGDWLEEETALPEVIAFVERIYLEQDLSGFGGDLRYVQSEVRQRSFSKLRSSIGGLYAWRAQHAPRAEERDRMLKEADFAFRQAFVLCPGSPEAVFRYVSLLIGQKRLEDAIRVSEAAVGLEEHSRPAAGRPASSQADFAPKPMVESCSNPSRPVTQLGSLLEQLKRMRMK